MGFQEKLRSCRKQKGLTQGQLGALVGLSGPTIRMYELGLRRPTIDTLKKIANVFNLSTDVLLENEGSIDDIELRDIQFRKTYESLSPESQKDLLNFLEFLRIKEAQNQAEEAQQKKNS